MSDVAAYHVFVCALFTGGGRHADCMVVQDIYVNFRKKLTNSVINVR